jgi:hypothetical protein
MYLHTKFVWEATWLGVCGGGGWCGGVGVAKGCPRTIPFTPPDRRLPNPDSVLTMTITIPDTFIVSSSSTLNRADVAYSSLSTARNRPSFS